MNYSLSLSSRLGYSPKNTDLKMVKDGFQLPLMWWYEHIHPEDVNRVFVKITESIYSCEPYWADEYRIRRADGTYMITLDRGSVVYDETGRPVRMVGVMMDITTLRETEEALRESHNYLESCVEQRTQELQELNRKLNQELIERKLLENQLVQSQKLESLGMLTAGIAHEINNPIGYVSGNLAVMKRYLSSLKEVIDLYRQFVSEQVHDESAKETFYIQLESICSLNKLDFMLEDSINIISESQDGARRVKEIVESLRGFSRMDHSEVLEANINQCLDSALRIVWNELKYKCVIAKDYQPLPNILCYAGQLNQVFMNLLVNAAQSIEERGIITLKTYVMDGFIVVQCTDTGCGIPPEQLPFIFDPFYTTKPVGQGTGLGLSISYGIIQRHQGKINVESTVGVGTTFTITLPLNGVADQSEPSMGTAA